MPKEKSINPAQAQRKADKAKAVKKGKAEAQSRRNEKLARRNPERLQKQLDDLKAIETSGGKLTSHEKSLLEGLEKDVKAVRKAREALGDSAPKFGRGGFSGERGGRGGGVLGKRRRDNESSDESDVPEDVRNIPMPRDTPPPIPKEVLDKWYQKRRERHGQTAAGRGTNANNTPLGQSDRMPQRDENTTASKTPAPVVEAKTVYEAKPIVRDLRKEAVSAFMPAAVRLKMEKSKGTGGLVEPEEADALEKAGYMAAGPPLQSGKSEEQMKDPLSRSAMVEEVEDEDC
ncbi:Protein saf1 [Phlyctema vagabunda]|uniref:Protein saf1 n=1 Tax=Phlyctema vagabunda TaxID=108571 RepID=A0ABR4PGD5_9HELO